MDQYEPQLAFSRRAYAVHSSMESRQHREEEADTDSLHIHANGRSPRAKQVTFTVQNVLPSSQRKQQVQAQSMQQSHEILKESIWTQRKAAQVQKKARSVPRKQPLGVNKSQKTQLKPTWDTHVQRTSGLFDPSISKTLIFRAKPGERKQELVKEQMELQDTTAPMIKKRGKPPVSKMNAKQSTKDFIKMNYERIAGRRYWSSNRKKQITRSSTVFERLAARRNAPQLMLIPPPATTTTNVHPHPSTSPRKSTILMTHKDIACSPPPSPASVHQPSRLSLSIPSPSPRVRPNQQSPTIAFHMPAPMMCQQSHIASRTPQVPSLAQNSELLASALLDDLLLDTVQFLNAEEQRMAYQQMHASHLHQLDTILHRVDAIDREEQQLLHGFATFTVEKPAPKVQMPMKSSSKAPNKPSPLVLPLNVVMHLDTDSNFSIQERQKPAETVENRSRPVIETDALLATPLAMDRAPVSISTSVLSGPLYRSIEKRRLKFLHHRRLVEASLENTGMNQAAIGEILEEMLLEDLVVDCCAELEDGAAVLADTLASTIV